MQYEIISTEAFDKWLSGLKTNRARVIGRLLRIEVGNFDDFKKLEGSLYELRLFFRAGYRVYTRLGVIKSCYSLVEVTSPAKKET